MTIVGVAMFVGVPTNGPTTAQAAHDCGVGEDCPPPGNWTAHPKTPDDRIPGKSNAEYVQWGSGLNNFRGRGLEQADWFVLTSEEISFANCSPFNAEVFGFDRRWRDDNGNIQGDDPGLETDDSAVSYIDSFSFTADKMRMKMNEEGSMGETTHFNATDQFVADQTCYDNPGTEGWYRMKGWMNGTNYDGEYDEARIYTHWFYIGDYDSREEAIDNLGPPPSQETTPTATATPTPTDTEAAATQTDTEAGATQTDTEAGATQTDTEADATPTDTEADATPTDTEADATPTDTEEPDGTPAGGPGFGVIATLSAVFAAGLLVLRRTN